MADMTKNIKDLLTDNGFDHLEDDELDELAEEISESVKGLEEEGAIADTIYGNLVALGVDYEDVDDLMGIAEKIARSL